MKIMVDTVSKVSVKAKYFLIAATAISALEAFKISSFISAASFLYSS